MTRYLNFYRNFQEYRSMSGLFKGQPKQAEMFSKASFMETNKKMYQHALDVAFAQYLDGRLRTGFEQFIMDFKDISLGKVSPIDQKKRTVTEVLAEHLKKELKAEQVSLEESDGKYKVMVDGKLYGILEEGLDSIQLKSATNTVLATIKKTGMVEVAPKKNFDTKEEEVQCQLMTALQHAYYIDPNRPHHKENIDAGKPHKRPNDNEAVYLPLQGSSAFFDNLDNYPTKLSLLIFGNKNAKGSGGNEAIDSAPFVQDLKSNGDGRVRVLCGSRPGTKDLMALVGGFVEGPLQDTLVNENLEEIFADSMFVGGITAQRLNSSKANEIKIAFEAAAEKHTDYVKSYLQQNPQKEDESNAQYSRRIIDGIKGDQSSALTVHVRKELSDHLALELYKKFCPDEYKNFKDIFVNEMFKNGREAMQRNESDLRAGSWGPQYTTLMHMVTSQDFLEKIKTKCGLAILNGLGKEDELKNRAMHDVVCFKKAFCDHAALVLEGINAELAQGKMVLTGGLIQQMQELAKAFKETYDSIPGAELANVQLAKGNFNLDKWQAREKAVQGSLDYYNSLITQMNKIQENIPGLNIAIMTIEQLQKLASCTPEELQKLEKSCTKQQLQELTTLAPDELERSIKRLAEVATLRVPQSSVPAPLTTSMKVADRVALINQKNPTDVQVQGIQKKQRPT